MLTSWEKAAFVFFFSACGLINSNTDLHFSGHRKISRARVFCRDLVFSVIQQVHRT